MADPTIQILAVAGTMLPAFVYGIDTARESRNIVHPILGSSLSDVTLRPASLRSGTLTLAFTGATADADSLRAMDIHAGGNVLTLVYTDMASANMSYVATGRVTREPESATRGAWLVSVEYQEVSA